MSIPRRCIALLAALLLLTVPRSHASEQTGSITVRMTHDGHTVSGGSVTLYRVAELGDDWQYVPEFADSCLDRKGPLSPADAEQLAEYAQHNAISGQTEPLGSDGTAIFSPLQTGLYLLVQREPGAGYLPVKPFFISVPQQIGGEWICDVDAGPKCAPEPAGPGIPQTGQLRWPVPVMTALGLCLMAAGLLLYRRDRHAA